MKLVRYQKKILKMKKILFSLVALMMLTLTTGCTDDIEMRASEYYVTASDWVTNDQVNYYFSSWYCEDITPDVVANGAVMVYVYDQGRQNQLPYVLPYYSAANDVTIPENIRFDWSLGTITFIIEDLDGFAPEGMADIQPMTFKVVVFEDR